MRIGQSLPGPSAGVRQRVLALPRGMRIVKSHYGMTLPRDRINDPAKKESWTALSALALDVAPPAGRGYSERRADVGKTGAVPESSPSRMV